MKTILVPFLVLALLVASVIEAADGALAADLNKLNEQRFRAASNAADAEAMTRVETVYYQQLLVLREKAVTACDDLTVKKIDTVLSAAGKLPTGSESLNSLMPQIGSERGGGNRELGDRDKIRGRASVLETKGDVFVLKTEHDKGSIWIWDLKMGKDGSFEVIKFFREQASKGMETKLKGVIPEVRGDGEIKGDSMKLRLVWPQGDDIYRATFTLTKQE